MPHSFPNEMMPVSSPLVPHVKRPPESPYKESYSWMKWLSNVNRTEIIFSNTNHHIFTWQASWPPTIKKSISNYLERTQISLKFECLRKFPHDCDFENESINKPSWILPAQNMPAFIAASYDLELLQNSVFMISTSVFNSLYEISETSTCFKECN